MKNIDKKLIVIVLLITIISFLGMTGALIKLSNLNIELFYLGISISFATIASIFMLFGISQVFKTLPKE